jgi:hypothetical protein
LSSEARIVEPTRAVRRPRWLPGPRHTRQRRRSAFIASALAALLIFVFARALPGGFSAEADLLGRLAAIRTLDARWDAAILKPRAGGPASALVTPDESELEALQATLTAAASVARGRFKAEADALRHAFIEKSDLATRFAEAHENARDALAASMRAEAAVAGLVRAAWSTHPDRERLIAAENLVALVLSQAQQYHHTPAPLTRSTLEEHVLDLRHATGLPPPLEAALARLETDIHRLLLVKPLERMLFERLLALDTGTRLDALTQALHARVAAGLARQSAYRTYLALLLIALAPVAVGLTARAARRARTRRRDPRVFGQP